jgi:DNA-directed RNA polymerase II subunit RPB3
MAKHFQIRKDFSDYLEFNLINTNVALANAIRRIVLSEIEIYAIDEKDIHFTENTCPLHNEYIAHRLSLVPIKQNVLNLDKLKFTIAKNKTTNTPIENGQTNVLEVTTNDVQVYNPLDDTWIDPSKIFDGVYLITKLNLKQKILGEFKITKGIAKDHSRWQCVSTIAYRYLLEADKGSDSYDKISLEDEKNWIRTAKEEPLGFVFYLEPLGGLSGKYIIHKALEVLKKKCEDFKSYLVANKDSIVFDKNGVLELEYEGETHTLGNLIASLGLDYPDIGDDDFIGYRIIHPMLNRFMLKLKINYEISKDARGKFSPEVLQSKLKTKHINVLGGLLNSIIGLIDTLIVEWKEL